MTLKPMTEMPNNSWGLIYSKKLALPCIMFLEDEKLYEQSIVSCGDDGKDCFVNPYKKEVYFIDFDSSFLAGWMPIELNENFENWDSQS